MHFVLVKKRFSMDPKTVYMFLTKEENVIKWWGPKGTHLTDHKLNLGQIGPWHSTMANEAGESFRASGNINQVKLMRAIKMTFHWDSDGPNAPETYVTIDLSQLEDGGTDLTLKHEGLRSKESERHHREGWDSSLKRLEELFAT